MQNCEPIKMSAWLYVCENIIEFITYLSLKIDPPFPWKMGFRTVTELVN